MSMLNTSHMYIPNKDRPDYLPPSGYVVIKCRHNAHSNFLEHLSSLMKGHVKDHGEFDGNHTPILTAELPPNLGRQLPNMAQVANSTKKGKCICQRFKLEPHQLHCTHTAPTQAGRTQHVISTDTNIIAQRYPRLAKVLQLPDTYVPNEIEQAGDNKDLLDRTLAKINEWSEAVAPAAKHKYIQWIGPYQKKANQALIHRHKSRPISTDPIPAGWEEEYQQAMADGLVITQCDKSNQLAFMCSHLPAVILKTQVDLPTRYARAHGETEKTIRKKNQKAFGAIYKGTTEVHKKLPMVKPTWKNHKVKEDPSHPYIESTFRTVTSYYHRGNAHQQKDLSSILGELEDFHCKGPDTHIVSSSTDFNLKLKRKIEMHATADVVGMFDQLNSRYAAYAITTLLKEMYEHKRITMGRNAHLRILANGKAIWSKSQPDRLNTRHFPITRVTALLNYLLQNDYVTALGRVWKSVTGVPMGGAAASRIASLTAFFAERIPLARLRQRYPNFQYYRYADDIYYTFRKSTFDLYFAGAFAAAGFTLKHEKPEGPNQKINFLECTVHLPLTTDLLQEAWTTHYNRKYNLFPRNRWLPHRGSATSTANQKRQMESLIRRIYHNTSRLHDFVDKLRDINLQHKEYSKKDIAKSTLNILTNTHICRYELTATEMGALHKCIRLMHTCYVPSRPHTHIFKK